MVYLSISFNTYFFKKNYATSVAFWRNIFVFCMFCIQKSCQTLLLILENVLVDYFRKSYAIIGGANNCFVSSFQSFHSFWFVIFFFSSLLWRAVYIWQLGIVLTLGSWQTAFRDLSSPTRYWTWAPAVKAQSPNQWTAREFPWQIIFIRLKKILSIPSLLSVSFLLSHEWK